MNVNEIRNSAAQLPNLKRKPAEESPFADQLKSVLPATSKAEQMQSTLRAGERPAALTDSEKEYFEQLFPNSVEEISSYNPYEKDGLKTAVQRGTLIDRKG